MKEQDGELLIRSVIEGQTQETIFAHLAALPPAVIEEVLHKEDGSGKNVLMKTIFAAPMPSENKIAVIKRIKKITSKDFNNTKLLQEIIQLAADDVSLVRFFMDETNADPNQYNEEGYAVLHLVVVNCSRQPNTLAFLLSHFKVNKELPSDDEEPMTALELAVLDDDMATVKILLASGVRITVDLTDIVTVLHLAVENDNVEMLRDLWATFKVTNPDFSICAAAEKEHSLLSRAINLESIALVREILENIPVDITLIDSRGYTPLELAVQMALSNDENQGESELEEEREHVAIVEYLYQAHRKLNPNFIPPVYKDGTLLHLALPSNNKSIIRFILENMAVDVNAVNDEGVSALSQAVADGKKNVAAAILANPRVNKNCLDREGNTPLHLAVLSGDVSMVGLLLQYPDVDKNIANIAGLLPMDLAFEINNQEMIDLLFKTPHQIDLTCYEESVETPLHQAATCGDEVRVSRLLEIGFDVNCQDADGDTALHQAVRYGQIEMVSCLLANGSDITIVNEDDLNPLQLALLGDKECFVVQKALLSKLLSSYKNHPDCDFVSLNATQFASESGNSDIQEFVFLYISVSPVVANRRSMQSLSSPGRHGIFAGVHGGVDYQQGHKRRADASEVQGGDCVRIKLGSD